MKKKSILISVLLTSFLLTGCSLLSKNGGKNGSSSHIHAFEEEWSCDDTYHYHKCSVVGCIGVKDKEEHQFKLNGNTYVCEICGIAKNRTDNSVDEYLATKNGHYPIVDGKKGEFEEHTLVDTNGDKTHVPVEPTCDRAGKYYKQCFVCKRFVDEVVPALGHDMIEMGVANNAVTCERGPKISYKCARCGYIEEHEGAPLGHEYKTQPTSVDSITKETCERSDCLYEAYIFDCTKTDKGWNAIPGTNSTEYKMGATNVEEDATWNIPTGLIPDGNYAIEIECQMTSDSQRDRYFFNHALNDVYDSTNYDSADDAPYRYQFATNGNDFYINPDNRLTYGENGISAYEFKYVRLVSIYYLSNLTSFTLHHGKIAYSLKIRNVKLVRTPIE